MNESAKTGIFVAFAAVFLIVAFFVRPSRPERDAFDDSGERFFAPADPLDARSLEIVSWDETTATADVFKVAKVLGVWSLPSHEEYPADAETQLAEAAAEVLDLVKGPKVSDSTVDHALYGVLDPVEDSSAGEGLGRRVTIQDASGLTMADFIIGKPDSSDAEFRFVRVPGRDRVYRAKFNINRLTTRFEDWIEDDLLKLDQWDVRQIVINDYSIDEIQQRIVPGDRLELAYDDTDAKWSMDGLAETEQIKTTTVNDLKRAVDDLKIIDVHRKPAGLSAELRAQDEMQLDGAALASLSARGFYIAGNSLVSNQGETIVKMLDGVSYVLRFGEIALGDRSSGQQPDEPDVATPADEGASRYLFVMAEFDQMAVVAPEYEDVPELPAAPAAGESGDADPVSTDPASGDPAAAGGEAGSGTGAEGAETGDDAEEPDLETLTAVRDQVIARNERKRADYEKRLEDGRAKVQDLNERFADWYYVISNDVYQKIRLTRDDLVEETAKP